MKNRKTLTFVITAGILGAILAAALLHGKGRQKTTTASSARIAPEFRLPDPSGKEHALSELAGRPVLVHFWAAWCPPCLEEIPNWIGLSRKFDGKRLAFVAVSLDPKWGDALKVLPVKQVPPNVLSLIDTSGKLAEAYGTYQFPETYLLNARHEIIHKWVGGQDWANPATIEALERISR